MKSKFKEERELELRNATGIDWIQKEIKPFCEFKISVEDKLKN